MNFTSPYPRIQLCEFACEPTCGCNELYRLAIHQIPGCIASSFGTINTQFRDSVFNDVLALNVCACWIDRRIK